MPTARGRFGPLDIPKTANQLTILGSMLVWCAVGTAAAQAATSPPSDKAGYEDRTELGGPSSVSGQLVEDDRVRKTAFRFPAIDRALQPWFDWKRRFHDEHGVQLGFDYNVLYQRLDDGLGGDDDAMSGAIRAFGWWNLVGRGTGSEGSIFFKVEQRHELGTDIAPADLAAEAGYIGITGLNFNDAGLIFAELNYQHNFQNRSGLIVGRFDPNDYMNVLGYANPWSTFSNISVLLDSSLAYPDFSWGAGAGHRFQNGWYVGGTINDANGTATNEEFFEGGAEFIKMLAVGWYPTRDERYFKRVSATVWHVDDRDDAGVDSADGLLLSANWTWNRTWMIFGRAGFSDGDAPIYNENATAGFGRIFRGNSDILGVAVNWGDPPADSLDAQTTTEVFYNLAFARNLQITPSIQWLHGPALNPEQDDVLLFGLRLRLAL